MKEDVGFVLVKSLSELRSKYDLELLNNDPIMGVYFLIHNGEIVYVGKSKDIRNRLHQHKDKSFDDVFYIRYPEYKLSDREDYFINILKPMLNKTLERWIG